MFTKIFKFSVLMILFACILNAGIRNIWTVEDDVINFTTIYTSWTGSPITSSTTLASIGIIGEQDTIQYTMELEDSFQLTYQQGDANGIVTVGDAITLIQSKL